MVGVNEVNTDGAVTNARLTGTRCRQLNSFEFQNVGAAGFMEANLLCHGNYLEIRKKIDCENAVKANSHTSTIAR